MERLSLAQLPLRFQAIGRSQLTGNFRIQTAAGQQWYLLFRLGRLAWASGGEHRVRRWYRCLKRYCPELDPQGIRIREQEMSTHWEYAAITALIKRQQITREQAIALIEQSLGEILFDILYHLEIHGQLACTFEVEAYTVEPLTLIDAERSLQQAKLHWQHWFEAGLVTISPNLVPVLKQPAELEKQLSPTTYTTLRNLLNGNSSLRDLAQSMKQDLLMVARSLMPYFQQGVIGLQSMADLTAPNYQLPELQVSVATNQPLIACIDDSLDVCQTMSEVLTQSGYRFISVQDSFQALPMLLAQKPHLIFLDLVMPIASGYELCAQIRRVSAFKDVPVVILTGNDGIVDRVRAKMVGASDFLSKPVDAEKVMAVVRRHLRQVSTYLPPQSIESAESKEAIESPSAFL